MELANFAVESVPSYPLMPGSHENTTCAGIQENKTSPFMCADLKFISIIFPLILMHRYKFVYGLDG